MYSNNDNTSDEEYDLAFLGKCKEVKLCHERKGRMPGSGPDQQDSTLLKLNQELALLGLNNLLRVYGLTVVVHWGEPLVVASGY